jgi:hypothetical protein
LTASAKTENNCKRRRKLIAKAGLLENLQATTTAGMIKDLKTFAPTVRLVYDRRFVDNGKVITTAGLSSGIDGALHLIEKIDGLGWAKWIAAGIEYNWQPDSDYARAALADTKFPDSSGNVMTDLEPLDIKGDKEIWEEKWAIKTPFPPKNLWRILIKNGPRRRVGRTSKPEKRKAPGN